MHQYPLVETLVPAVGRGTVLFVEGGTIIVALDGSEPGFHLPCDVLWTGNATPAVLTLGDAVLVWRATPEADRGVILGRIGAPPSAAPTPAATAPAAAGAAQPAAVPDELVIEARQCLTLRVGDGSITIRADGKILIKGKDLVSHAQRMNRIRGGAVAIN